MKFKESDRTHQIKKDKSKPILIAIIKVDDDIPHLHFYFIFIVNKVKKDF